MNVYEAIEASPIGYALHMESRSLMKSAPIGLASMHQMYPDGWQPLAVLEQYTLGEPLTEDEWDKLDDDSPIIYKTVFGPVRQSMKSRLLFVEGVRYADPRPWPTLPEKKPRYTYRDCGECFRIERDGKDFCAVEYRSDAELLVKLLNESEGE